VKIHSNDHKMNYPSRTDNPNAREGWNQSPNLHSGTTREDFNGMANTRVLRRIEPGEPVLKPSDDEVSDAQRPRKNSTQTIRIAITSAGHKVEEDLVNPDALHCDGSSGNGDHFCLPSLFSKTRKVLVTFGKFVGPGFMVCTRFGLSR
jgi:metal iron transporter